MGAPRVQLPPGTGLAWFETLGSTNDEARRLAVHGVARPLWIVAERQNEGRGRRGRVWTSGAGNLTGTYLCAPALSPAGAAQLSFAAALAVADLIDVYLPGEARVKWPNDVLIRGRKIAGILLESATGEVPRHVSWLAIGIGVNLASHPEGTEMPATSLAAEGIAAPASSVALERLAAALDRWIGRHRQDGFEAIRKAWLARGPEPGTPVEARLPGETLHGEFADLNGDGALILRAADGSLRAVMAGEVFFGV